MRMVFLFETHESIVPSFSLYMEKKLGPTQFLDAGFMDYGKFDLPEQGVVKYGQDALTEAIIIDLSKDTQLMTTLSSVDTLVNSSQSIETIVSHLANMVYELLGGPIRPGLKYLSSLEKTEQTESANLLGAIHHGMSRPRALLFKILCDRAKVPCSLMALDRNHYWNVVTMPSKDIFVEVNVYHVHCLVGQSVRSRLGRSTRSSYFPKRV
jgi:hypothetical protein